ncbi:DUF371 domain-containing protein [Stygiolobus caldivivus]|uniref:DUF371 domain-containing protein n=1 Tax=Stygiolobus caldivivus TaxID=2824673 RepID=A0A8D5ZIA2_9CREN|nr:DUF371 domain-containing protein [Stygiolobus caldivivus]BCU69255.1 hypothetical protein KN1_05520 [Stygiolobus caldivivus]
MIELIKAEGHYNVRGIHKTTLEVTKDDYLTPNGDCIIGINATKGAAELSDRLKEELRKDDTYVYAIIVVDGLYDLIAGKGSSKFTLSDPNKIILRRSTFISDATVMINANKAAKDVDRKIVQKLQKGSELLLFLVTSDSALKDEEIFRIIVNFYPISFS